MNIYDAEIFPIHTGLIDQVTNRDSNMLPTPLEFTEQDTLLSHYQASPDQTQHNHLNTIQNVSKNLVHLYNVPKQSVFRNQNQSHNQKPKCNCNGVAWFLFDEVMRPYLNSFTCNVNQN